jgi:pentatricopeptide repeat protein
MASSEGDEAKMNRVMAAIINAHSLKRNWRAVESSFQRLIDEYQVNPDTPVYDQMLVSFSRANNIPGMMKYYNKMKSDGVPPSSYTFNTLIHTYAQVDEQR